MSLTYFDNYYCVNDIKDIYIDSYISLFSYYELNQFGLIRTSYECFVDKFQRIEVDLSEISCNFDVVNK